MELQSVFRPVEYRVDDGVESAIRIAQPSEELEQIFWNTILSRQRVLVRICLLTATFR